MFTSVIVGVDELERGRDAIALAADLVSTGGKLTLAYVYHGDPHVWRGSSPPFEHAEHERATEVLEAAARDAGIDAELRCHGSTSVGHGLHDLAEATGADLLVVGCSRRGVVGRVLLGDDTRAALNGAPCAVAIAPAGFAQHPRLMREIGVGYNGSLESEHALGVARALATEHHAKLSAFEAVSIPAIAVSSGPVQIDEWMEGLIDDARKRVSALRGVEPHAIYGQAADELAMFSASVDLLVVGSRSYGPFGRLVHGSTSQQLARIARCPLLVLPRPGRADIADGSENAEGAAVGVGGPSCTRPASRGERAVASASTEARSALSPLWRIAEERAHDRRSRLSRPPGAMTARRLSPVVQVRGGDARGTESSSNSWMERDRDSLF
jgi:nucleotide-binding universal stress UspA family protein